MPPSHRLESLDVRATPPRINRKLRKMSAHKGIVCMEWKAYRIFWGIECVCARILLATPVTLMGKDTDFKFAGRYTAHRPTFTDLQCPSVQTLQPIKIWRKGASAYPGTAKFFGTAYYLILRNG